MEIYNHINKSAKMSLLPDDTDRQFFVKYGRKNGLRALTILMEYLSGDSLKNAQEAYDYLEGKLRYDRFKGRGKYAV